MLAFAAVVTAFATDFIGGLIGVIGGAPDFGRPGSRRTAARSSSARRINALIYFVIVAAVVYFVVVVPMNKLMERRKRGEEPEAAAPSEDVALLQEIRDLLRQRSV